MLEIFLPFLPEAVVSRAPLEFPQNPNAAWPSEWHWNGESEWPCPPFLFAFLCLCLDRI